LDNSLKINDMKKLFFFLVCFTWASMVYATYDQRTLSIIVDTAYVSNELNIELEYRVLAPFSKIHLSVRTSMEDPAARQSEIVPMTVSGTTLSVSFSYYPFDFPNNNPPDTKNSPTYFGVYRQMYTNATWESIGQIAYNGSQTSYSQSYTVANPTLYNYKLTVNNPNESAYPKTIINHSNTLYSLSFSISPPTHIYTESTKCNLRFNLTNFSGISSFYNSNYVFNWYVHTAYGWDYLGTQSGHPTSEITLCFPDVSYIDYGSGYVKIKCVGSNAKTGQSYETSVNLLCIDCAYARSSPTDSIGALESDEIEDTAYKFISGQATQSEEEVNYYPNPVTDILHVNLTDHSGFTVIKIFDAWGNEVKHVSPVNVSNQIRVQNLPTGNYILTLMGYEMYQSFKFIKL